MTTLQDIPEHRQFTEMMHDVHLDTHRERQLKTAEPNGSETIRTDLGECSTGIAGLLLSQSELHMC